MLNIYCYVVLCCVGPLPVLNVQLQLDLEEFIIVVKSGNCVICANVNEDDTVLFTQEVTSTLLLLLLACSLLELVWHV